jgi:hypothetical protein
MRIADDGVLRQMERDLSRAQFRWQESYVRLGQHDVDADEIELRPLLSDLESTSSEIHSIMTGMIHVARRRAVRTR